MVLQWSHNAFQSFYSLSQLAHFKFLTLQPTTVSIPQQNQLKAPENLTPLPFILKKLTE
jgi:hypothetical protein